MVTLLVKRKLYFTVNYQHLYFPYCHEVIITLPLQSFPTFLSVEPVDFLTPLEDQEVNEIPGTATFECEISKKNLKAEWRKGGKPISANKKYKISVDGGKHRLVINDVIGEDEDEFTIFFEEGVESTANLLVKGQISLSFCSGSSFSSHL